MSQGGHFRAHGRREVDLSAILDGGDAPKASDPVDRPSTVPARPIRIVNLSLGGACIEAAEAVTLGASLELEIVAPTLWDPLVLKGRVVWSRADKGSPHRAGLAFEASDPARAFALFELLSAHDYDG